MPAVGNEPGRKAGKLPKKHPKLYVGEGLEIEADRMFPKKKPLNTDDFDFGGPEPNYQDLSIVRVYTFKGIKVIVGINLIEKTISLLEAYTGPKEGGLGSETKFRKKEWVFAEREHRYLPGWLLILEAMQHATIEAGKVLAKREAQDDKKFRDLLIAVSLKDLNDSHDVNKKKK